MAPTRRYMVKVEAPPNSRKYLFFEINRDGGTWTYVAPFHPERNNWLSGATGTCEWDFGSDQVWLLDRFGRRRILLCGMDRASTIGQRGNAFQGFNLGNGNHEWQSSWEACGRPLTRGTTGIWFGIAGKGGGEVFAGADAAAACVINLDDPKKGMCFIVYSGRLGLGGGGGANFAACLVTGVHDPNQLQDFAYSGSDWAVSIGGPLKEVATGVRQFGEFVKASKCVKFAQAAEVIFTHADAMINLGKTILVNSNIDPEEQCVSLLDLPGPGIELSYYWYWARVRGVTPWAGKPILPQAQQGSSIRTPSFGGGNRPAY